MAWSTAVSAWPTLFDVALWIAAVLRFRWVARQGRESGIQVGFLDLPLGLAASFPWHLPSVVVRERLRGALLGKFGFAVTARGEELEFRSETRSPWFGVLWSAGTLPVYAGSMQARPEEGGGCRVVLRFSTVPLAGWSLLASAILLFPLAVALLEGGHGAWLWIAAVASLLAVRSAYQAEARRLCYRLLERLL